MELIPRAIASLLMPPGIVLVLLLGALALSWRRLRGARILGCAAWAALYLLSTPYIGAFLLQTLQPPPLDTSDESGQAIVVLGGGTYFAAPEYGGDTVNQLTLVRLRYAAHVHRMLGKPLAVSGGSSGRHAPEARAMKQVLERELGVPVAWAEEKSSTTLENARGSLQTLGAEGIRHVYLVTHAWHMPRARYAFESAGFTVIAAPTGYAIRPPLAVSSFLPNAQSLLLSSWFFHEVLGLGWYHLRLAIGH